MKRSTDKPEVYQSELIDNLINEISPEEQKKTDRKMILAARISDAMKAKDIKKGQLAKALNKKPSEITKWLSGTHNFTAETLWNIGDILGIELINLEESKSEQIVYHTFFTVYQQADDTNWWQLRDNSYKTLIDKPDLLLTSN